MCAIVGIILTRSGNVLSNFTTERNNILARCVTGLGPAGNSNNELGRWYFNEIKLSESGVCGGPDIQSRGANINNRVGVIDLFQCAFSITWEGVYTCIVLNSSMVNESMRLGVYFDGRSESFVVLCV